MSVRYLHLLIAVCALIICILVRKQSRPRLVPLWMSWVWAGVAGCGFVVVLSE